MSVLTAAIQILEQADAPLHVEELAARMIAAGLWTTKGKTPGATVSARLYSDIKTNGGRSPFVKVGPQIFALQHSRSKQVQNIVSRPTPAAPKRSKQPATTERYSFTKSAAKVLDKFADNRPMHYKAITTKAIEQGWLATEGKTPEISMYAQIITEIRRQQKRGEQPRFVQHGRGYFGLSRWMGHGVSFQIEQHNQQVRAALLKRLHRMHPSKFEELISQLLAEMGFETIEVTSFSNDGGIDVRGTLVIGDVVRITMAVQAKRWKVGNNVQAPVVQQVRGSIGVHEQGLIITTSDFSRGAKDEAVQPNRPPIALMNGEQLVTLLMEHGIGVQRSTPDLFEIDDEFIASSAP